jgi:hypothetical protein
VTVDADRPQREFSSGVGESESVLRHRFQPIEVPTSRFGSAAFAISEASWNAALGQVDRGRPAVLHDRQLPFGDEPVRFTFEYVPRWKGDGPSSTPESATWIGPVVVRAHFRGHVQAVMELAELDGAALHVAIGRIDGRPALRIDHSPHYNNSFTSHWVWSDDEHRFVRLSVSHSQGC